MASQLTGLVEWNAKGRDILHAKRVPYTGIGRGWHFKLIKLIGDIERLNSEHFCGFTSDGGSLVCFISRLVLSTETFVCKYFRNQMKSYKLCACVCVVFCVCRLFVNRFSIFVLFPADEFPMNPIKCQNMRCDSDHMLGRECVCVSVC